MSVNSLVFLEILDMQIEFVCDPIFDEHPDAKHLDYQGLAVNGVVWESLGFELSCATVEIPVIVREIQRCDEQ